MALATMLVKDGKRSRCLMFAMGTREEEGEGEEEERGGAAAAGGGNLEIEGSSAFSGHCELNIGLSCVYGTRNRSWLLRKAAKADIVFRLIRIIDSNLCVN
jgi:hypothetical protein